MGKDKESFSIGARIRSFSYALAGVRELLKSQHNAWIHLLATAVVTGAGLFFGVHRLEWALLIMAMTIVWTAEALNTALEFTCDAASPDFHPLVKKAKDVAAGAVLLASIGAAALGVLVFYPYIEVWFDF